MNEKEKEEEEQPPKNELFEYGIFIVKIYLCKNGAWIAFQRPTQTINRTIFFTFICISIFTSIFAIHNFDSRTQVHHFSYWLCFFFAPVGRNWMQ